MYVFSKTSPKFQYIVSCILRKIYFFISDWWKIIFSQQENSVLKGLMKKKKENMV